MASIFAITAATNSVQLDGKRQGSAAFTVFNGSGRALRGRARLVAENKAAEKWLSLSGEAERDFSIAGTQQYTVQINVPKGAAQGNYPFHLDMAGVSNPDEDFTEGPNVTFEVGAGVVTKGFPWWIAVAAVVVLLVVGGVVTLLLTSSGGGPNVPATQTAEAANLLASSAERTATAQAGATATINAQATATAIAMLTANANAQSRMTATAQAQLTVTAIAQATTTAQAQATATAVAMNRYAGVWIKDSNNNPTGLSKLTVSRDGPVMKLDAYSQIKDVIGSNGGYANSACPAGCPLGSADAPYTNPPLTFSIKTVGEIRHQIKLLLTDDGSILYTEEKIFTSASATTTSLTYIYLFHREGRFIVNRPIDPDLTRRFAITP